MSNVDTDTGEGERKKVSKRGFLAADGSVVKRIEEATGAFYQLLGVTDGGKFERQFGAAGDAATMLACMGFHTKVGNEANTVLNDKDDPGSPDDAAAAVTEWLRLLESGKWAERGEARIGAKIDRDVLAQVTQAVMAANGQDKGTPYWRDLIEQKPSLVRDLRQVPAIKAAYDEAKGVKPKEKSVSDILGALAK